MYLEYFGLQEEPFSMTPDPRFIYWSEQHENAAQSLLYAINHRKGFSVLTGEIGTGKTTLCREVLHRLRDEVEVSVILNPLLSVSGLLKTINRDFGIAVHTNHVEDQIHALNTFLVSRNEAWRNAIVLIDESQNLSNEALEMVRLLSNLETDNQKLLQIVLVGQPELDELLSQYCLRQLKQRITVRQHLGNLTQDELRGYIAHRLFIAGNKGALRFDDGAIRAVYHYSKGYPRLTNALCDRALLAAYATHSRVVTKRLVAEAIGDLRGPKKRSWWRW